MVQIRRTAKKLLPINFSWLNQSWKNFWGSVRGQLDKWASKPDGKYFRCMTVYTTTYQLLYLPDFLVDNCIVLLADYNTKKNEYPGSCGYVYCRDRALGIYYSLAWDLIALSLSSCSCLYLNWILISKYLRPATWEPSYLGLYITQTVEILYMGLLLYTCVCIST